MNGFVFVFSALLLSAAAAAFVVVAFRRPHERRDRDDEGRRDRLRSLIRRELEDARASGDLHSEDLAQAESDLGRMVDAYGRWEDTRTAGTRGAARRRTVVAIALMVVLTASLYAAYGGWRYVFFGARVAQRHDLRLALHSYHRHLAHHPDDARGWRALARGYVLLGHDRRAARAYRHLVLHGEAEDPTVLADYVQALILAGHGRLDARELALDNRALALDPDQPKALWWGGLLALAVRHDRARALRLWNRLLRNPTLPAAVRAVVVSRVVALGGTPETPALETSGAAGHTWRVTVTETVPGSARAFAGRARLYVFLRDPLEPHRPPYYVRAVNHPVFPLVVSLSSADSPMGPPSRLPSEVELVGLLSLDGRASPAPGDLEGRRIYSRSYLMTTRRLRLRVDERLGAASHASKP